ncbi:MAG: SCP-like extracellular [Thermoleophilia bacterium]|nr:SCP-like extracellular [Thermoleophilia bacterium]
MMEIRTASTRPARLAASAALVLAAIVLFLLPGTANAALPRHAVTIDTQELAEVKAINRFRVARGLPALRIDGTLTRAAGWHALDMGTKHRFSHTDSLGRDPFARLRAFNYPSSTTWRGENIAAGNEGYVGTYRQWLNSPPHKANWMNGRYRVIGIARVYVPGSPYGYYWATNFGSAYTGAPAR